MILEIICVFIALIAIGFISLFRLCFPNLINKCNLGCFPMFYSSLLYVAYIAYIIIGIKILMHYD